MDKHMDWERVRSLSQRILEPPLGECLLSEPVAIKEGARSCVLRCRVNCRDRNVSSVIIKQNKDDAARGFSDWASLAFLSQLPETQNLCPRFYGGDVTNGFFLMEDLGTGENLNTILCADDSHAVRAALRLLATNMARLQSATLGKQTTFETMRANLPEAEVLGRHREAANWLSNRPRLFKWFEALGCSVPSRFDVALQHIHDVYAEPEDFLTFTHGDPAPSNNHFDQNHARLLDFEYGGFRHALYDITAWNILCPLPADCVREMRDCFQQEFEKTCPAAREETRFAHAWSVLCAYRALAILTWIPPTIIEQDQPWADNWTMRGAVFAAISRLEQATISCEHLLPVHTVAQHLLKSLSSRWPISHNVLPRWAALESIQ
ncbi:hypothetical protein EON83_02050 [bacterium]|nr:MAG: hypothetical protein EON83_02050 [bacterium]